MWGPDEYGLVVGAGVEVTVEGDFVGAVGAMTPWIHDE